MSVLAYDFPVYPNLEIAVKSLFGSSTKIVHSSSLGGGCIGSVKKIVLTQNQSIIVKEYRNILGQDICKAEGNGLQLLAQTNTITVPKVYAMISQTSSIASSIIISYFQSSSPSDEHFWVRFAHQLAALHNAKQIPIKNTTQYFGLDHNNYIGATPQSNTIHTSWIEFFALQRIWNQCELASKNGYFDALMLTRAEQFCRKLSTYLEEPKAPSLLHGDLWSGNYLCSNNNAVVIDPAVYYGHYEADIAMTELFGGYPESFYRSYSEINELDRYYHTRKHIYNLYHLLNHLNLFGTSYLGRVISIIDSLK